MVDMLSRHEDILTTRLEALRGRGFTHIDWWELYQWYGMERLSRNVWRDLQDRFLEVIGDPDAQLYINDSAKQGILLIYWNNNVKAVTELIGE